MADWHLRNLSGQLWEASSSLQQQILASQQKFDTFDQETVWIAVCRPNYDYFSASQDIQPDETNWKKGKKKSLHVLDAHLLIPQWHCDRW